MESALIISDIQIPFHDPLAWEVMQQIGEDVKPDYGVINGDGVEWRHLSMRFAVRDIQGMADNVREETDAAREMFSGLVKRVKCKKGWRYHEGNHEWRLFRAVAQLPQVLKLLGLKEIERALSVEAVLGLADLNMDYAGEYPAGSWLFKNVAHENNVFVHHSYMTRKKAGYHAHAEIDLRMCSTIIGHGERLAVVWRRGMDRRLFACEGGNLSILGEAKRGAGIYTSVPFNQPEFMDRQQGFVIVYRDGNDLFPVPVPIHTGKAVFNGRLYKA